MEDSIAEHVKRECNKRAPYLNVYLKWQPLFKIVKNKIKKSKKE